MDDRETNARKVTDELISQIILFNVKIPEPYRVMVCNLPGMIRQERSATDRQIQDLSDENAQLKYDEGEEWDRVGAELNQLKANVQSRGLQIKKLRAEILAQDEKIKQMEAAEKTSKIAEASEDLANMRNRITVYEILISKLKNQVLETRQNLEGEKRTLAVQESYLREVEHADKVKIRQLEMENRRLSESGEIKDRKLWASNGKVKELEAIKEPLLRQVQALEAKTKGQREHIRGMSRTLERNQAEITRLANELTEAKTATAAIAIPAAASQTTVTTPRAPPVFRRPCVPQGSARIPQDNWGPHCDPRLASHRRASTPTTAPNTNPTKENAKAPRELVYDHASNPTPKSGTTKTNAVQDSRLKLKRPASAPLVYLDAKRWKSTPSIIFPDPACCNCNLHGLGAKCDGMADCNRCRRLSESKGRNVTCSYQECGYGLQCEEEGCRRLHPGLEKDKKNMVRRVGRTV